ncbi:MAG: transcription-repair coupling factor [Planctomycetota bacterium]|jgi:transcription-repair coupling factor (superfamily II helicase)|nr:transcription-repair coupling factor [Planctomycetota bacterium]
MRQLRERYRSDPRTALLVNAYRSNSDCTLGAVQGGLAPVLIAAAISELGTEAPRLAVCGDPGAMLDDLEELGISVVVLPEMDEFEQDDNGLTEGERHVLARRVAALEAMHSGALIVATARAVDQAVPDLTRLTKRSLILHPGETHDLHALSERLVDEGYQVAAAVEHPGQLAVRGGLLDVFPLAAEHPLRIEFFDDEVDVIRRFDAFTQESIARCDQAVLSTGGGVVADASLWSQLPPGAILVLADVPLSQRLRKAPHGRAELRLARQLEQGAEDGASVGVERFKGDLRNGLPELQDAAAANSEIVVFARNDEARREMEAHCRDHGIGAPVRAGRLSAGFRDLEADLLVVHDFELSHRRPGRRKSTKVAGGAPLDSLTDLKQGNYVVHVNHGIASFKGMATLERRGYMEDFLLLSFADDAKLYVPVTAIDLVQKYIGGGGRHPELSKLGGTAWKRKKARAEKAVEDLTADLLATAAEREAAPGIAHDPDDPQLRRFEAAFPFEETEDQLTATREIKGDMELPRVMDRLLCGDVGFGKTEIAMRAAYKAVASGHQVAVLAPTTLLTEQHLSSFRDRFEGFAIKLACLNRFRTPQQRREILEAVRLGEIDILIGTHAILSEKLKFDHLGLVVIDEEHRFGVKQKELLKQVATGVDMLTLSATPIPRTLHFSLLGLRNISVLAEAPSQRLAIETRVAPWDKHLIRTAMERELERGGQIFFVHNRVKDIDAVADKLARMVPEMRMEVVHGQMDESRIGSKMHRFRTGQVHCLVATSIIESGIDIPNANTLFVNNAHAFGLAELHQIRGRIGRFTQQAFAYFITPPARTLSVDATARLDAIQEYAELGAGFKLAMRDLELRGAGNLLGPEQSGQIDAVGYELYCKLLADAVQRSGLAASGAADSTVVRNQREDSTLAFPIEAYVPDTYLDSPALKFELHKQLDACRTIAELRGLLRVTRDRYGRVPEEVTRLFQMRAVRQSAADHRISRIETRERQLRLHCSDGLPGALAQVKLPELIHVQLDGDALVLFTKLSFDADNTLPFLMRLFAVEEL